MKYITQFGFTEKQPVHAKFPVTSTPDRTKVGNRLYHIASGWFKHTYRCLKKSRLIAYSSGSEGFFGTVRYSFCFEQPVFNSTEIFTLLCISAKEKHVFLFFFLVTERAQWEGEVR